MDNIISKEAENRVFCKGYTWGFFSGEGQMLSPEAEKSMKRLASNGLDWICITVNAWQETYHSTEIFALYGRTQTDEEIIHAISMAKALGLKVCLKPMVNCLDRVWRAKIDFPVDENGLDYWKMWFASYNRFMLHYARMAEKYGCEMLCTGCEMFGMDKQSAYCSEMIKNVRQVYSGLVMHNINHGDEMRFDWLQDVDIIGISGYYPVTSEAEGGRQAMLKNWNKVVSDLEECHKHFNRPIMFAEIGVRNEMGCSMYPWDFHDRPDMPIDEEEQADFYDTAMEATWNLPWFSGYFWWDWKAVIPEEEEMKTNRDFTVYGKKAEKVLKKWYSQN
ncbi:MAG: hypothetical protein K6E10_03650 [Eubacterium sp.]|nr:hypothetical protein [Eubacterium sp.]